MNAAGPWATQVARAVRPAIQVPDVDLVQGTHIVLPMRVSAGIYYVEGPADGRAIFIMPWKGETLIGTTETPYKGDPDQVRPLPEEEEYLLNVARHYFPSAGRHDPGRHPRALRGPCGCCPRPPKRPSTGRGRRFLPPTVIRIRAFSASTAANSPVGAPLRRKF